MLHCLARFSILPKIPHPIAARASISSRRKDSRFADVPCYVAVKSFGEASQSVTFHTAKVLWCIAISGLATFLQLTSQMESKDEATLV